MSNVTDNDYAKYAAAGELFGRLRDCLGFGELAMFAKSPDAIVYRWTFTAGSERWFHEVSVTFESLEACQMQWLVFSIADLWNNKDKASDKN